MDQTFDRWKKSVADNDREYPPEPDQNKLSKFENSLFIISLLIIFAAFFYYA